MTSIRSVASLLAFALVLLTGCGALFDAPAARREALAEARFPPGGQIVTIDDGRQVHAVVAGRGPDLVLIHGAGGNTRDFSFAFMDRLTDRYRVIAFDRPGLGHSDRASDRYGGLKNAIAESPAEQAAMLKAAADKLGVHRPIVLGQSYGGTVALAWALDYDPAALVVVSGTSHPWPGGRLGLFYDLGAAPVSGAALAPPITALTRRFLIDLVVKRIFKPQDVPDGYVDYLGAELTVRRESFLANARQVAGLHVALVDMAPRYGTLDLPVEIVHGLKDEIVPPLHHSLQLKLAIPGAELTLLEEVGHMPHHARPEAVEAAIDRAASRAGLR